MPYKTGRTRSVLALSKTQSFEPCAGEKHRVCAVSLRPVSNGANFLAFRSGQRLLFTFYCSGFGPERALAKPSSNL